MSFKLAYRDAPPGKKKPAAEKDLGFKSLVGESAPFREAVSLAKKVSTSGRTTVLLVGETGTGKELFARGIHYSGPAGEEPFVAVNCAAIPASLMESELFGHERGAFTDARSRKRGLLELAGEGTLLLDEIGDLPLDLQPKLLRALEERRVRRLGGVEEIEVRCRMMAATNESLEDAVAEGGFREDLFYRLNVFRIRVPPLRERADDIELLARHFLQELVQEQGLEPHTLSICATQTLRSHSWPGNIRQLKNVIERAAILAEGGQITEGNLEIQRDRDVGEARPRGGGRNIQIPPEGKALSEVEAEAIRHTLEITKGNQSAAARILGISRPTIIRKMRLYGLEPLKGSWGQSDD
jgi:DNA-binding NtrC family response regulator